MTTAIRDILAIPFGWALGAIYELSGNYLLALVVITVVLRLILLPSSVKQQKNSAKQMRLQAKVNKIRQKYAAQGREAQMKISEETQELYKREGYNPTTSGCVPLLLQLVVMMGLYGAIYEPLTKVLHLSDAVMEALKAGYLEVTGQAEVAAAEAYRIELHILNKFDEIVPLLDKNTVGDDVIQKLHSFVSNFNVFGVDLTAVPKEVIAVSKALLLIPILAGVSAMLSSVYTYLKQRKSNPEMANNPMMGCMTFMSPAISVYFAYILPAGIGFYWIISNILSFIQLIALAIFIKPADIIADQMIDETVQRRSREQSVKTTRALMAAREEKNNE